MDDERSERKRKRGWDITGDGDDKSNKEQDSAKKEKAPRTESTSGPGSSASSVTGKDAVEEAAERALRINQLLAARGVLNQELQGTGAKVPVAVNVAGSYSKNIEINDVKNRYVVTKESKNIKEATGAEVITRGKYYPDKNLATERDPPLYLHVSASTQDSLNNAVAMIEDLIEKAQLPVPETRPPPPTGPPQRPQLPQAKIYVGVEADRMYNVRAKIVGPRGEYVKHIQATSGAKVVQLKGRGSGFIDHATGQEADDNLYIHLIFCYFLLQLTNNWEEVGPQHCVFIR
ncbi:hypothetical protein BJ742DRAFT_522320 [Cladochytrium replicatum]|nr:hypothetical protein BJ742DRAFT_522320 [Cladochytrium replicatum]